jgi:hypothetical protein
VRKLRDTEGRRKDEQPKAKGVVDVVKTTRIFFAPLSSSLIHNALRYAISQLPCSSVVVLALAVAFLIRLTYPALSTFFFPVTPLFGHNTFTTTASYFKF